jgi:HPt (histidine-containing phosphotransfer) domain-containing protein
MTAHTMQGDRDRCIAAGMDDYVAKPLRLAEFQRVLARVLPGLCAEAVIVGGRQVEDGAVIDQAVVEDLLSDGGREEGILELFVGESRRRLRELEKAVGDADAERAGRIVHSLKGSCATFGAVQMAAAAERLYSVPRDELLAEAARAQMSLSALLERTERALAQFDALERAA